MIRHPYLSLFALLLSNGATFANVDEPDVVTGVTNVGLGTFMLAIAALLIMFLLLRPTVTQLVYAFRRALHRRRVDAILSRHSQEVLTDLLLESPYGGLTRVDYAVLLAGGIVCMRSKLANGEVVGYAEAPQWTLRTSRREQPFLNPLVQNEGRADALRKLAPELPVVNLVVFGGDVSLGPSCGDNVIRLADLDRYLRELSFEEGLAVDWEASWLNIRSAALTDDESHKDFAAQLSFG